MRNYDEFLAESRAYYGDAEIAFHSAAEKYANQWREDRSKEKILLFIGMMMTKEESDRLAVSIKERLNENYFIMVYRREEPKIEVFYSKDLVHINANDLIESIKKLVAE